MGKITGFKEYERVLPAKEAVEERVQHFKEFNKGYSAMELYNQSARCMDCGIPFCHSGCPLGNDIPKFNDAVYQGKWEEAYHILSATNNFPEFTGRICPAPCESACVLGMHNNPITIEEIEKHIVEIAFTNGYVKANKSGFKTGKRVAVVGSGPAGLAAAAQLNKAGHEVVVFERADQIGGLLRYGIPDFKLEKSVIDRRVNVMKESGIEFRVNAEVGKGNSVDELKTYDAIVLATGSTVPWPMQLPGSDAKGIHYAMDFLIQQNKEVNGSPIEQDRILATDKHVVVVGDGDTGSDCIGTAVRQRAKSVTQIARKPMPSPSRLKNNPWPLDKVILNTSTSHEEGCERLWATETQEFLKDENGFVKGLKIKEVHYQVNEFGERVRLGESEIREIPADLVLLAIGYKHTEHTLLKQLGVQVDVKGNILATNQDYKTTIDNVFTAGDCRKGQSLVVWAIAEGRACARKIDQYLMGSSELETKSCFE